MAGADVSVNPVFSILLKLLKELIYTQRFISDSVLETCPRSQSKPVAGRALTSTQSQTRCFTSTRVTGWPGCSASQVAAGHTALGTYPLLPYFLCRSAQAAQPLGNHSLGFTAKGLHILSTHPLPSWTKLSLPCYVAIPSMSLQDVTCHQSGSLDGHESPAPSLLYSLTSCLQGVT